MTTSAQFDSAGLIATETHNSAAWAAILVVVLAIPATAIMLSPRRPLAAVILVAIVGVITTAMALTGFQYRFYRDHLEIRMFGFRLRSIPRSAIVSYAIEPWAFIRGYGIRGIGRTRAYVWSNKVVHITTTNAEIYLGHNDPARVVHDLDQMTDALTRG